MADKKRPEEQDKVGELLARLCATLGLDEEAGDDSDEVLYPYDTDLTDVDTATEGFEAPTVAFMTGANEDDPEELDEAFDEDEDAPEDLDEAFDEDEDIPEELDEAFDEDEDIPEELDEAFDEDEDIPEELDEDLGEDADTPVAFDVDLAEDTDVTDVSVAANVEDDESAEERLPTAPHTNGTVVFSLSRGVREDEYGDSDISVARTPTYTYDDADETAYGGIGEETATFLFRHYDIGTASEGMASDTTPPAVPTERENETDAADAADTTDTVDTTDAVDTADAVDITDATDTVADPVAASAAVSEAPSDAESDVEADFLPDARVSELEAFVARLTAETSVEDMPAADGDAIATDAADDAVEETPVCAPIAADGSEEEPAPTDACGETMPQAPTSTVGDAPAISAPQPLLAADPFSDEADDALSDEILEDTPSVEEWGADEDALPATELFTLLPDAKEDTDPTFDDDLSDDALTSEEPTDGALSDSAVTDEAAEAAPDAAEDGSLETTAVAPDAVDDPVEDALSADADMPSSDAAVADAPTADEKEDGDDLLDEMPEDLRRAVSGHPLGKLPFGGNAPPPFVRISTEPTPAAAAEEIKPPEELYYPEYPNEEFRSQAQSDSFRKRLARKCRLTAAALIAVTPFVLFLLLLEHMGLFFRNGAPALFEDPAVLSAVDAMGLLVVALLGFPVMKMGLVGIIKRRLMPESILLISCLLCLIYTLTAGLLGAHVPLFSFVPALGVFLFLMMRIARCESDRDSFSVLLMPGDKMVFSVMEDKEIRSEAGVLGVDLDAEKPRIFRMRKVAFVSNFRERTEKVCEDFRANTVILILATATMLIAALVGGLLAHSLRAAVISGVAAFLTAAPLSMCAAHIYPMARVRRVVGNDSAILGESTVRECGRLHAVAFEDVTLLPSRDIRVKLIKVYAGEVDQVLYYASSLFHATGGPLAGYFGRSTGETGYSSRVTLKESVPGGLAALVDGAVVLFGDDDYMERHGVEVAYEEDDDAYLASGKIGIMHAVINGKACAKFYVQYALSPVFEHHVKALHRRGIAGILRTYDPNLNNKLLASIAAIGDYRIQVITKKPSQQYTDFAAERLDAGLVTSEDSGKLMQMLFLCLRTKSVLRLMALVKVGTAAVSAALAILACVLLAVNGGVTIPSALLVLYQLLWLIPVFVWTNLRIRLPGKKPKNERKSK